VRRTAPTATSTAKRRLALSVSSRVASNGASCSSTTQPKADLRTGRIVVCEALVGCGCIPTAGLLPPMDFVPDRKRPYSSARSRCSLLTIAFHQAAQCSHGRLATSTSR